MTVGMKANEEIIDRSKLKNVEMPVFGGDDLDVRLFRVGRYFHIHKHSNHEKLTVSVINFEEWLSFGIVEKKNVKLQGLEGSEKYTC